MSEPTESIEEINARLATFKRTADPTALWPDVPREIRIAAQRETLTTMQRCLRVSRTPPTLEPTAVVNARAISVACSLLGVGPLLGYWIERHKLDGAKDVKRLFARHLEYGRERAAVMRQQLLTILDACNQRGIEPTVLKGAYTGLTYFPEFGTRPLTDIDLLVEPASFNRASEALTHVGLRQVELSHGESSWYPRGLSSQVRSLDFEHPRNPWSVDLHLFLGRRFFVGHWARFGDRPRTETRPWVVEGCKAKVFSQPFLSFYLAQHAVHDFRTIRLLRIVELVLVLRRDIQRGALTWEALAAHLPQSKTGRSTYPAFELCARLAPDAVDPGFLSEWSGRATPRQRRVIDRWWNAGVTVSGAPTWDEQLMWAETPYEVICDIGHQLVRRCAVRLSPLPLPRLRYLVRQQTGIAPRQSRPPR